MFPFLPSSTRSVLPHLFAALPSVIFLWNVLYLRQGFLQLLASCLVTYGLALVGKGWGKRMPWIVFTVVMGHLAYKYVPTPLLLASLQVSRVELIRFAA